MTVLITGAAGFIGSHLARHLVKRGEKVVSLVHDWPIMNEWFKESLEPTIRVRGDIRNISFLKRVLNQYEVSKVFHLAAQSIVKSAWKDPVNTFDVNVMGTVKLLEACRQLDVDRVLVQATDKVYGNEMDAEVTSRLKPTEPYGSSKVCVDLIAQTFAKTYNMRVPICRCCNVYGYDWNNRIIPNTIKACLRNERPVIFKGDYSKRQYIHVHDAVRALEAIINTTASIINIGTEDVLTQEEVVLKILAFFPPLKPRYVEKPLLKEIKNQSLRVNIDPSAWKPRISFDQGIRKTIAAYRMYGF